MGAIEATGWNRFVELFRGDMEAVRDVATVFLEESESQRNAIQRALEDEDADAVRRVAHSLQSTARQIGATELAASAAKLEACGKQGDVRGAQAESPRFFAVLADTREELRARLG